MKRRLELADSLKVSAASRSIPGARRSFTRIIVHDGVPRPGDGKGCPKGQAFPFSGEYPCHAAPRYTDPL